MAADGGVTALALSVFFGLCVPGVSSGKIKQTMSTDLLVPLTSAERTEFAGAIKGEDAAFRVKSERYFVLVTTKGGHCHVLTGEGDTQAAKDSFLVSLKKAGGSEDIDLEPTKNPNLIEGRGIIWTNPQHDGVVVGFTADKVGDKGFYAWAFGIHKD
jgi:hypothetical protein